MSKRNAAAKTLSAVIAVALASLASAAPAQVNPVTTVAYDAGRPHTSPFDSLGGIGGKDSARNESANVLALQQSQAPQSPFDSLGGIGGQGSARSDSAPHAQA